MNTCELSTYVHIPTGFTAVTCYELSIELTNQRSVYFLGAPWIEWERIKTEKISTNDPIIRAILEESQFEIR